VIVALKQLHWDEQQAATQTGQSLQYVRRWKKHYQTYGNVDDKPRTGRPRKISGSVRAAAVTLVAEEQSVPAATAILKQQQLLDPGVSVKTVLRAVRQDMHCTTLEQKPILSASSRAKRRAFCQEQHDTNRLIAIDSSYFTLGTYQRGRRYWAVNGTRPTAGRPNRAQQLHVYGGITAHGTTKLVFVTGTTGHRRYKYQSGKRQGQEMAGVGAEEFQDVMRTQLVPQAQQLFAAAGVSSHVWLMDNAPAHAAKSTQQFLRSSGIETCKNWPPNSPDLNPIENVWAAMKRQVYSKHHNTLAELRAAVQQAWAGLPVSTLKTLMTSIDHRKAKCLQRGGGHAGY
jgi:transposase